VRELQSVLKQALVRATGPVLLPTFLPEMPGENVGVTALAGGFDLAAFIEEQLGPDSADLYAEVHRRVDRLFLARVLSFTGGNQHQAARLLGIARHTLRMKLRDLGLHVAHSVEADEEDRG
jgi:two-component system nitrogen regulation response regulator GlnG